MDLRQLEMFRAVAEEGSFTRAARRLHVSQSAISRQVLLLEDELKAPVLNRGPRRATATPAGELLLAAVNRVGRELQEAVAQIEGTRALARGSLSLAGGMTVCMYVLPRVLRRYRSLYPGVELSVFTGASDTVVERLRRRELDVALLTLPVPARDLEVRPALREQMGVVLGPGHPLGRERSVAPAALSGLPLVLYEAGSNTRRVLDRFFEEEQVAARVAMETENVEIIKAMVGGGLGVSVIPYAACAREVKAGRLLYRPIRGRQLVRETGWVYLKTDHPSRAVSELIRVFDDLRDRFPGRPPKPEA
jgi:DNA-binding transcriptional LysR family regulator